MVEIYVKLIMSGRRTLNQIPERLRDDVNNRLIELGYITKDSDA